MGLAHRVIPTILCRGRQLVKGKQFNSWRSVGLAVQAVRIHAARGVDELVLLDIGATPEGRGPNLGLVEELTDVLFPAPLAVGGGIRSLGDVKALLRAGADKVVIGTGAVEDENLVRDCTNVVGSQAIVVAIDHHGGMCWTRCGKVPKPTLSPIWMASAMEAAGAGEILLTNVEREGTMLGYDIETVELVRNAIRCPLIAHGGCSGYEDMANAVRAGANAVAAGALFQFTDATPRGAAEYLQAHGIEARV